MTQVTITPLLEKEAIQLSEGGKKWRKQILPRGKFNYKGEVIDFDEIGKQAKTAFEKGALDQVAFQLADAGNNHNFDPKNYRGEVEAIELTEEGTFGVFDFSKFPDVHEMVEKNPKFGVSAQIERQVKKGDGALYPYAFSHILGTLSPKVTGMKPWEKLQLSKTEDDVLDLTDIKLSEEGGVPETKQGGETVTLSADEVAAFRKFVANQQQIEDSLKNMKLSETDDEDEQPEAVRLANETANNAIRLAQEAQIELAETRWEKLTGDLAREGVPPVALSKAEELMKLPKMAPIKLSNGTGEVDPQAIMLSVLESLKGTIDLSQGKGHEFNESESSDKEYESFRDEFMRDFI